MRLPLLLLLFVGLSLPLLSGDAEEALRFNQKAKLALEQGRAADAVTFLEAALARSPDDETLIQNLAWAHYQVGEAERDALAIDRAAAAYQRAWDVYDGEPAYGLHLASLRLRSFRLAEALAAIQAVLERHPDEPTAHLLLGDILALLDRLSESEAAYRVAAELSQGEDRDAALAAAERTARQADVEADYQTLRTSSFVLRAPPGRDHNSLLGVLRTARVEVLNAFAVTHREPALVVLYPPDAFREVTGLHDWVGGLFDRKIRLPIADARRDAEAIGASFRHEYTHLLVSEWSPRCPTFLNEGAAQLMELGRGQGMTRLLAGLEALGLSRDDVPTVEQLPDSFIGMSDRDAVRLGYLTSYAFVDHVAEHHGLPTLVKWLRATDAQPLDEAFAAAAGRSLAQEQALFRELLRTAP